MLFLKYKKALLKAQLEVNVSQMLRLREGSDVETRLYKLIP